MTNKTLSFAGYLILAVCLVLVLRTVISGETPFSAKNTNPAVKKTEVVSPSSLFDANFPDADGKSQALKQWKGKVIVLNFWATWCPPCREEMPELSKLYTQYEGKNVVIVGVSTDDVPTVKKFTNETKVSYPLLAADMAGSDLAFNLGNNQDVLPYTVVIKTDGSIAKTFFGRLSMLKLEETLKQLI